MSPNTWELEPLQLWEISGLGRVACQPDSDSPKASVCNKRGLYSVSVLFHAALEVDDRTGKCIHILIVKGIFSSEFLKIMCGDR